MSMNFTVSTKPLSDALALGVINANVSKFYRRSCLAQVTADRNLLRINLEAAFILSEIRLRGKGDADASVSLFVDSLLLKQLVSTLDSSTVTFEFAEGGLILHSGKSRFTLPKMIDDVDVELKSPSVPAPGAASVKIDRADWKFVKDRQMYAIAMSFVHPVYTKVWLSQTGDVVVGDFDNSIFTHSEKSKLGKTCLISDTIVNLFTSLPDGSDLVANGDSYIIFCKTDGFELVTEFTPQYESDESVGSYSSDIILPMMEHSADLAVQVNPQVLNRFLNQAALLSTSNEDTINLTVSGSQLSLHDKNVDCVVEVAGNYTSKYSVEFRTTLLKDMLSTYSAEQVSISPMIQEDVVVGIVVWDDALTTVLAGIE